MSFQAMAWAVTQDCGSPTAKLVLMMLANHANGHTGQCNPRHKLLAQECNVTVETLKANLKRLEVIGLVRIVHQFSEGVQLPNHYELIWHGGGVKISPEGGGNFWGEGGGNLHREGGMENSPPYNLEDKQEEKPGIKPTPPTPKGAGVGFEEFWEEWPSNKRKCGKSKCLEQWKRRNLSSKADAIIDHVRAMKESQDWRKNGGEFVPMPLTYLNQARWDGAELSGLSQEQAEADATARRNAEARRLLGFGQSEVIDA